MNVLVTGGTGFIGSALVEQLRRRGDDVVSVAKDRLNLSWLESLGVRVVMGDLNDSNGWDHILAGVECVYHLAGVTRAQSSRDYYEGNHHTTRRLLERCVRHGNRLQRFLYVSSLSAVGPAIDGRPVDEATPFHPVSHYGISKMRAEMEVLRVRDQLPVTIVRPSAVYGPRERELFEYMKLVSHGIQPLIGFRQKTLNLIHSADLVEGLMLAATSPHAVGETYILGSTESCTTRELGSAMAHAMSSRPLHVHVPHALVYGIGALAQATGTLLGHSVMFNVQKARESVQPAWTCSVQKAQTELGFRARLSLDEGMRMTYRWYQENGWLH
jgi:dihydroflavonol-4-reductase